MPTGPPLNLYIIDLRRLWSVTSKPSESTFNFLKEDSVISKSILPVPSTKAKSLIRLRSLFAILGVPLLLFATS